MSRKFSLAVTLTVVMLTSNVSPSAAQTTAPLAVTALVLNTCTVAAVPLTFVDYSPVAGTPTTGQTVITVATCFDVHEIAINGCTGGTGTGDRKMDNPLVAGAKLDYSLSCLTEADPQCQTNWGDAQGTDTLTGTQGALELYTVDGVIAAGQQVASGAYIDNCVVSLQF